MRRLLRLFTRGQIEDELNFKSKQSEMEKREAQLDRREAQLKKDLECVGSLKVENQKLTGELIEQKKCVEKLQTQLREATWSEIGLHKRNDESQMKQIQVCPIA